jgi:hypothetical protein
MLSGRCDEDDACCTKVVMCLSAEGSMHLPPADGRDDSWSHSEEEASTAVPSAPDPDAAERAILQLHIVLMVLRVAKRFVVIQFRLAVLPQL